MKDKTRLVVTGVVAVLAVVAAFGSQAFHVVIGDEKDGPVAGPFETTRLYGGLGKFDGVTLAGPDEVLVTRGDSYAVRAIGQMSVLRQLDIQVADGVLHIGRKPGTSVSGGEARLQVTMPSATRLVLAGPGDLTAEGIGGRQFRAEVAGPGDMTLKNLQSEQAQLSITGAGDLVVDGKARSASFSVIGPGNIRAEGFETARAALKLAGSGEIEARATGDAEVSVTGPGSAQVTGTTRCKIVKSGPGDAECTG